MDSSPDVGGVDASLGEESCHHMQNCIGDMVRFDVEDAAFCARVLIGNMILMAASQSGHRADQQSSSPCTDEKILSADARTYVAFRTQRARAIH